MTVRNTRAVVNVAAVAAFTTLAHLAGRVAEAEVPRLYGYAIVLLTVLTLAAYLEGGDRLVDRARAAHSKRQTPEEIR